MCHGGHHDARNADEKNARKQRITARKDFAGARMHHIDRAHAAQDHRGIENGVYPGHIFEPMIPQAPNAHATPITSNATLMWRAIRCINACCEITWVRRCSYIALVLVDGNSLVLV